MRNVKRFPYKGKPFKKYEPFEGSGYWNESHLEQNDRYLREVTRRLFAPYRCAPSSGWGKRNAGDLTPVRIVASRPSFWSWQLRKCVLLEFVDGRLFWVEPEYIFDARMHDCGHFGKGWEYERLTLCATCAAG